MNKEYVLIKDGAVLAGANNIGSFSDAQLANLNDLLSMADVELMLESDWKAQQ